MLQETLQQRLLEYAAGAAVELFMPALMFNDAVIGTSSPSPSLSPRPRRGILGALTLVPLDDWGMACGSFRKWIMFSSRVGVDEEKKEWQVPKVQSKNLTVKPRRKNFCA